MKLQILCALMSLTASLNVNAVTERQRGPGMASKVSANRLWVSVEGFSAEFDILNTRHVSVGFEDITIGGPDTYAFAKHLFDIYAAPGGDGDQILTLLTRQITYANGATCLRKYARSSRDELKSGNFSPLPEDSYTCIVRMDLHNGATWSMGVPEERGRFGVTNNNGN